MAELDALTAPQIPVPGKPEPGIADEWKSWLDRPENRAAMLQTGLALMQPVGLGQSAFGHLASSVGQGAEAVGRYQANEQEETKARSKVALESSRAEAAASNAASRATAAEASRARAGEAEANRRLLATSRIGLNYDAYVRDYNKRKADASLLGTPFAEPLLSQQEWMQRNQNSVNNSLAGGTGTSPAAGGEGTEGTTAPAAAPSPVSSAPAPPKVGEERNGYIFQGGDPANKASWKRKGT